MQRGLACCATAGAAAMLSRGGRAGKKSASAAGTGGAADARQYCAETKYCDAGGRAQPGGATTMSCAGLTRAAARDSGLFAKRPGEKPSAPLRRKQMSHAAKNPGKTCRVTRKNPVCTGREKGGSGPRVLSERQSRSHRAIGAGKSAGLPAARPRAWPPC